MGLRLQPCQLKNSKRQVLSLSLKVKVCLVSFLVTNPNTKRRPKRIQRELHSENLKRTLFGKFSSDTSDALWNNSTRLWIVTRIWMSTKVSKLLMKTLTHVRTVRVLSLVVTVPRAQFLQLTKLSIYLMPSSCQKNWELKEMSADWCS